MAAFASRYDFVLCSWKWLIRIGARDLAENNSKRPGGISVGNEEN